MQPRAQSKLPAPPSPSLLMAPKQAALKQAINAANPHNSSTGLQNIMHTYRVCVCVYIYYLMPYSGLSEIIS